MPMGSIKLFKNFTLCRESMKATLATFKANKSVADVTQKVFQVVDLASLAYRFAPALAPSLTLVLVMGASIP